MTCLHTNHAAAYRFPFSMGAGSVMFKQESPYYEHFYQQLQARHTSHLTPHTPHLTPHTSHLTPHISHLTSDTSHLTPHTTSPQPWVHYIPFKRDTSDIQQAKQLLLCDVCDVCDVCDSSRHTLLRRLWSGRWITRKKVVRWSRGT